MCLFVLPFAYVFVCLSSYLLVCVSFFFGGVSQGRKHIEENATGPAGKDAKIIYRGLLSKSKCVFSLDLVQQRTYLISQDIHAHLRFEYQWGLPCNGA